MPERMEPSFDRQSLAVADLNMLALEGAAGHATAFSFARLNR